MRHHQHRGPRPFFLLDDVHQQAPIHRVKPFCGLIQDEQLRIVHDRHTELDLLLLPTRELVNTGLRLIPQTHPLEIVHRPGHRGLLTQPFELTEVRHHGQDGFFLIQSALLGEIAQTATGLRREWAPINVKDPRGRDIDPEQRSKRGGLARTVRTKEPERLPPLHVEGEILDDRCAGKIHPKMLNMNKRLSDRNRGRCRDGLHHNATASAGVCSCCRSSALRLSPSKLSPSKQ